MLEQRPDNPVFFNAIGYLQALAQAPGEWAKQYFKWRLEAIRPASPG